MTRPDSRRIAVVSGGIRQPSSTRLLADQLAEAAERAIQERGLGVDIEVVELREHAHELTDHLLTGFPSGRLRPALDTVTTADGLIAVTPIFNASYSGLFKTFFDVVGEDALVGVPVLMAATGGTARHSLALEHALRPLFAHLRAPAVPTAVYAASEDWGSSSGEHGSALRDRVDRAARELAQAVTARPPREVADPYDEPTPLESLLPRG